MINGKKIPFSFTLMYPVQVSYAKAVCEYIATALKEVGVECRLNGVENADWAAAFSAKNSDAIFGGWVYIVSPLSFPEQLRPIWHSSGAKEKGSQNSIGFSNLEADAIIEKLDYEYNKQERMKLYHRFHAIMHEEQLYTFLFIPTVTIAYRNYVQNLFISSERKDLVPGADVPVPDLSILWLKK